MPRSWRGWMLSMRQCVFSINAQAHLVQAPPSAGSMQAWHILDLARETGHSAALAIKADRYRLSDRVLSL